ncbi:rhodanese-like domain-containing protein [Kaustia mangrovi]|uniref:Rhodanese-like domain-containing protein n=1 Tax=Kaustia mangrovi TaxID=2593653 RepID=A0A7S8C5P4_9HYPH|nr:rhodanese-like domain-containing protein [Kaustia mangrovi]QPC43863.1 rhodanese-like domain-containing protein [Kaustia mangrovi]
MLARRAIAPLFAVLFGLLAGSALHADEAGIAPGEAYERARAGTLVLVDIRTPPEWRRTGIGAGAVPLDMRDGSFRDELLDALGGDPSTPVAVICASGGRSARLQERLSLAGFTNVIDVPEGMTGGANGPGWIARGLPLARYPAAASVTIGRQ